MEQCLLEKNSEQICLTGGDIEKFENRIDVKMMLKNKITGFLSLRTQYVDERSVYSYSVKGMVSLEQLLEDKNADFFLAQKIYEGIFTAWKRGQEFFLKETHFVLLPSYLFWNIRKEQLVICYFPGYESPLDEQMMVLSQFLLKRIEHNDKRCVSFVYGIYDLIGREGFSSADIAAYLRNFEEEAAGKKERSSDRETGGQKRHTEKNQVGKKQKVESKEAGSQDAVFGLKNISRQTGLPAWIEICGDSLTIGRSVENDFVIPVAWVSYHHARIDKKQSQFYVTDLGSTNGVYLNGKRLISNHPVLCREKDVISFADIAYCFQEQIASV